MFLGLDKQKIELLFSDQRGDEESFSEVDKSIRKRVLLSSDYRTAFKKKLIFEIFYELTRSKWMTE